MDLSFTPADVQEKLAAVALGVKNLAASTAAGLLRENAGRCFKISMGSMRALFGGPLLQRAAGHL